MILLTLCHFCRAPMSTGMSFESQNLDLELNATDYRNATALSEVS